MGDLAAAAAGFLAVALFFCVALTWTFGRSRAMLERWATEQGLALVEARFCAFRRGPFFWTTSKGQTVYRVTIRTAAGAERSGWARCGSFWRGLWSEAVEVRWDDEC